MARNEEESVCPEVINKDEIVKARHGFPVDDWDRYELTEFIGEGGMGRVYKARDLRLKRFVALKFLRASTPEFLQRFLQEAQAQARIDHENICKVYEVGEATGHPYIAMQYIEGLTLKEAREKLALEQKVKVAKDVAEALQAAHSVGLIHRDIKPDNIMLEAIGNQWRPYVMDFGLAREVQTEGMTVTGAIMGTPAYISPEQAMGEVHKLDHRTDIYSLGATLYELLAGRPPFGPGHGMEILVKVLQEDAPPLRKVNSEIAVDLETVVMKCLDKEPARRYESAKELADDLQRLLDGEPIAARPTTLIYRVVRKAKKNKPIVGVSVVAMIVMLVFGAIGVDARWRAAAQARLAQQFGQEIEKLEAILRYAHMLPLHDTGPQRELVRQRLKKIEAQIKQLNNDGKAAGYYALGRGYLVLQEYEMARTHLEQAWQAGYQTSEVKYALGQVMGALYQKRLEDAERINNKEMRAARKQQIEKEYRDPALAYLKSINNLQLESPAYVEGLIAFYEKRYQHGLEKAREAFAQVPWLYEAKQLEGDIYLMLGNEKENRGEYQEALSDYQRAGAVYQETAQLGRSDAAVYEQDCGRWVQVMSIEVFRRTSPRSAFEQALAACDKAVQSNASSWRAYNQKAWAHLYLGEYQRLVGKEAKATLDKGIELAQYSIKLNPANIEAYKAAAGSYRIKAQYENARGLDPLPSIDRAIEICRQALQINGNDAHTYSLLGNIYWVKGIFEQQHGNDPQQSFKSSLESYQQGLVIDPTSAAIYNNLGVVYEAKGQYEHERGLDPQQSYQPAIESYQSAVKLNPNDPVMYSNLANIYSLKAQVDREQGGNPLPAVDSAIASYLKSIQLSPSDAIANSNLGVAYMTKGMFEQARGLDARPTYDQSINSHQKAIALNANDAVNHINLGLAYFTKGQYEQLHNLDPLPLFDQAIKAFETALRINSKYANSYAYLGMVLAIRSHYEIERGQDGKTSFHQAIANCLKAIELNPKHGRAYMNMGTARITRAEYLLEKGQNASDELAAGRAALQTALKINEKQADLHLKIGQLELIAARLAARRGEDAEPFFKTAIAAVDRNIELNRQDAYSYLTRALIYRWRVALNGKESGQRGQEIAEGLAAVEKALAINAQMAEAVAVQGTFYLFQARAEQHGAKSKELARRAQSALEQAIKMNTLLRREYEPLLVEARRLS